MKILWKYYEKRCPFFQKHVLKMDSREAAAPEPSKKLIYNRIYIYIYICNYKSGTQEYTNTYPNICKHIYLTQKRTPPVGARDPALARSWPGPGPGGVLFCVSNIYVCIYLGMYWYIPVYQIYNYIYIYIYTSIYIYILCIYIYANSLSEDLSGNLGMSTRWHWH